MLDFLDDDEPIEIETVDLVGKQREAIEVEAQALPITPKPAQEAAHRAEEAPLPIAHPEWPNPLDALAPELREVAEEVITAMPRVKPREAIALVRDWIPKLGPDRFYAIFWAGIGAGIQTAAGMNARMQEGHTEGLRSRYAPAEIKRYEASGSPERRKAIAQGFGGIIQQIIKDPKFDYRGAIAEKCAELGIRWEVSA